MQSLNFKDIYEYVENNIGVFHDKRLKSLEKLKLDKILKRKNPYLFKAKNILTAQDLVKVILDAYLSSQEETIFGEFGKDFCDENGAIKWDKFVIFNSSEKAEKK